MVEIGQRTRVIEFRYVKIQKGRGYQEEKGLGRGLDCKIRDLSFQVSSTSLTSISLNVAPEKQLPVSESASLSSLPCCDL